MASNVGIFILFSLAALAAGQTTIEEGDINVAQDGNASSASSPPATLPPVSTSSELPPIPSSSGTKLDCMDENISFELITGYVYSAPSDMLDSQPGTLMLTDCIQTCRQNDSCQAVNYETGLCVLFSSNAESYPGALTTSQFPVFTIYVQKTCLKPTSATAQEQDLLASGDTRLRVAPSNSLRGPNRGSNAPNRFGSAAASARAEPSTVAEVCNRAWSFERVQDFELEVPAKRRRRVATRLACQELCLGEPDFICRSLNYNNATGDCRLSDMDRHTMAGTGTFKSQDGTDYMENNCVDDPVKLCEFQKLDGRILKTVDSVFQDIASLDDCRQLCLNAAYRCHSFDFGDTGDSVCRLSHHAIATLTHIQEPFLEIGGSSTYELSSCYNVTIDCRSGDMVAKIKTSKVFNGKIYAKGSPNSCVFDVTNSLDFELKMAYNDIDCNVRKDGSGRYSNDVILQHHDRIVTSADLGLSVHCQYDLGNKSVSNQVDLKISGDITSALSEEAIVEGPNVVMRVTGKDGQDTTSAQVGDSLDLRFEIVDKNSPYEIFVRDLVALDGVDDNEILLIDSRGCPTDPTILGPLEKSPESGKILISFFEAFKFPTSDVVQFRALVTPCLPACEPVQCNIIDYVGAIRQADSYGRKKRESPAFTNTTLPARKKRDTEEEEMLVIQTIRIVDKFAAPTQSKSPKDSMSIDESTQNQYTILTQPSANQVANVSHIYIREESSHGYCINTMGLIIAGALFLLAQLVIVIAWAFIWQRRRRSKDQEQLHDVTMSSLHQLYNPGYSRRM